MGSYDGRWTKRRWELTATVRRMPNGGLKCTDTIVSVRSSATGEWTTFTGGPLDQVIAERLKELLAIEAFRLLAESKTRPTNWWVESLTEEEVRAYHDLHPSPAAALGVKLPSGEAERVVLMDDDDKQASLYLGTEVYGPSARGSEVERELVGVAWCNM